MTAQFELMQKNIVDLLAEVKSEAESEAASAGNREREKAKRINSGTAEEARTKK